MSVPEEGQPRADDPAREQAREQALRQILSAEARTRLGNIRMVKPELAETVEQYLIGMASQGKIPAQIGDGQLKQILQSIQQPRRQFRINRV